MPGDGLTQSERPCTVSQDERGIQDRTVAKSEIPMSKRLHSSEAWTTGRSRFIVLDTCVVRTFENRSRLGLACPVLRPCLYGSADRVGHLVSVCDAIVITGQLAPESACAWCLALFRVAHHRFDRCMVVRTITRRPLDLWSTTDPAHQEAPDKPNAQRAIQNCESLQRDRPNPFVTVIANTSAISSLVFLTVGKSRSIFLLADAPSLFVRPN